MSTQTDMTARQAEVLEFIKNNLHLYSPTVREIAAAFRFKSPNGVMCHLVALERKGKIRLTGAVRGIEVLQ